MADDIPVTIVAGTLAPPACYSTEQERYEAYITATTAYIPGTTLQWVVQSGTPAANDQGKAWLRIDVNGYPKEILYWVTAAGTWVRLFTVPHYPTSSGGVANALTVTFNPTVLVRAVGDRFWFIAAATSTGATTLTVDGLAAGAIKKKFNTALANNDILAGQVVEVAWDGTNYQMLSPVSASTTLVSEIVPGTDGQTLRTRNVAAVPTTLWETSSYGTITAALQVLPTAGNVMTFAHGISVGTPITAGGFIQCITADLGYSVGDRVPWTSINFLQNGTADEIYTMTLCWDATLVTLIRSSNAAANTLEIPTKTGGAFAYLTEANWKCGAYASI